MSKNNFDDILEQVDLLSTDHVYQAIRTDERLPEDPGLYYCYTAAEEKVILTKTQVKEFKSHIKYWLEIIPKSIL